MNGLSDSSQRLNQIYDGERAFLPAPPPTPMQIPPPREEEGPAPAPLEPDATGDALRELTSPLYAVERAGVRTLTREAPRGERLVGLVPSTQPEMLGARGFREAHGVRYAYVAGAMAGGISSVDLVTAMGRAGMLAFFGAGGMPFNRIEEGVAALKGALGETPFGASLLANYHEPAMELETVDLFLNKGVRWVDAAAFMELSPAVIWFRAKGLTRGADGRIVARNHVFAKVSRPEVAAQFMAPAPEKLLQQLVASGRITPEEAALAALVPVAEDITAEADSGGHTDQRPFSVLLPMMLRLRDEAMAKHGYAAHGAVLRIGAGGGIGDPMSAHAAFSMGADYIMSGSINQACLQAGTSEAVKRLLLDADMADVAMAPAPDMFEAGARVQVLRRGTLYAQRAQKLYELYKLYPSFDAIPQAEREKVEKQIFQRPFAEVWAETERFWSTRKPSVAEEARRAPKVKMALCFRWYLGMSSRWALTGDAARRMDYQIWCGPSIGALNRWTKGTWLASLENRDATLLAKAILHGAATLARREAASRCGVEGLPSASVLTRPVERAALA